MERLNEVGLYDNVRRIAGVSGGSYVVAFLARKAQELDEPDAPIALTPEQWRTEITIPFLRLVVGKNRRLRVVMARASPLSLIRPSRISDAFARDIERWLTRQTFGTLSPFREFVFSATDLQRLRPIHFEKVGPLTDTDTGVRAVAFRDPSMKVASAVAASAAFPGLIPPVHMSKAGTQSGVVRDLGLTTAGFISRSLGRLGMSGLARKLPSRSGDGDFADGGAYDNTGVDAIWPSCDVILVSDGGGSPKQAWDRPALLPILRSLKRVLETADAHGREVQRWWLAEYAKRARIPTAIWSTVRDRWIPADAPIDDLVRERLKADLEENVFGPPVAGPPRSTYLDFEAKAIAAIRTDADAFSPWEAIFLVNHGYLECAAALEASDVPRGLMKSIVPPIRAPFPDAAPGGTWERLPSEVLRQSPDHRVLGRPYDWRTGISALRSRLIPRYPGVGASKLGAHLFEGFISGHDS